jgi:hypothetical protein
MSLVMFPRGGKASIGSGNWKSGVWDIFSDELRSAFQFALLWDEVKLHLLQGGKWTEVIRLTSHVGARSMSACDEASLGTVLVKFGRILLSAIDSTVVGTMHWDDTVGGLYSKCHQNEAKEQRSREILSNRSIQRHRALVACKMWVGERIRFRRSAVNLHLVGLPSALVSPKMRAQFDHVRVRFLPSPPRNKR